MGIDVAGCSQISILEGSYTVCQFISGDSTAACIDITAVGTKCSTLGIDVSATSLNKTAIGFNVAVADGSFAISQSTGSNLSGSGQICHTGDCACGSDVHIADFAGCCCHFAVCIHGERAACALDGAISLESCLCLISCITAGIETVFVHDSTIQAYFDTLIAQGNLVVLAFIQDHFCDVDPLGSYIAAVIDFGGVFLENVVIAQADATVHSFRQFLISTDAGCFFRCVSICAGLGFIGIRLVQSRKAVGHIGVDGIEPVHHILVNLFNDFILGFISTDAGSCFIIQALSQCSHIFADFLIRFHDTGILYRCISLAHIILGSLVFQIFLHLGDAGIQGRIAGFTGCFFRCVSIYAGLGFVGIRCIQSSESICHVLINGIDTLYQIFIDLLDHLVLSCISADAGSRFIIQALSQCGHIFADFLIRFHDTGILYRCISLCGKGLICTICGVHRLRLLRSSARIRLLDRHGSAAQA